MHEVRVPDDVVAGVEGGDANQTVFELEMWVCLGIDLLGITW